MSATLPHRAPDPVLPRFGPLPKPVRRVLGSRIVEGLTTPHGPSRYLEQISPLWSLDETRAVVTEVHPETADTTTLTLTPTEWAGAAAGQHVRVTVEIDGVRRTRAFSISSSAHRDDGRLQITVRANPDGHVSRFLAHRARPGLIVGLEPGSGEFLLPSPRPDDLVMVSGGSGITPVMSMLRTLVDEGHRGRVRFVHYARSVDELIFADELRHLAGRDGVEVTAVLTGAADPATDGTADPAIGVPTAVDTPLRGRICRDHLDALVPDRHRAETFVCGPVGLLDAVEEVYAEEGLTDRLHTERYQAPSSGGTLTDAAGTIRFTASDITVDSDGRSLLEQAEDAGLEPDFGCRMGICQGCVQTKPRGPVRDVRSGAVADEENEDIQLCITVPVGDVEIEL
jgi:stearoyl-CoA 9-desaturase NADPH oxidoreductase